METSRCTECCGCGEVEYGEEQIHYIRDNDGYDHEYGRYRNKKTCPTCNGERTITQIRERFRENIQDILRERITVEFMRWLETYNNDEKLNGDALDVHKYQVAIARGKVIRDRCIMFVKSVVKRFSKKIERDALNGMDHSIVYDNSTVDSLEDLCECYGIHKVLLPKNSEIKFMFGSKEGEESAVCERGSIKMTFTMIRK